MSCPYLGTSDPSGDPGPALDYPSFEHSCFALSRLPLALDPMASDAEDREQLLLADQATYCLGGSHTYCPRFRLVDPGVSDPPVQGALQGNGRAAADTSTSTDLLPVPGLLDEMAADDASVFGGYEFGSYEFGGYEDAPRDRRMGMGFWASIGALMLVLLLCGGSVAVYAGWQLVGRGVVTLAQQPADATPPTAERIVLMATATPAPADASTNGAQNGAQNPAQQAVAVQSIPGQSIPGQSIPGQSIPGPSVLPTPLPGSVDLSQISQPTASFDFPQAVTATPQPSAGGLPLIITTPDRAPSSEQSSEQTASPGTSPGLATAVAGPLVVTTPGVNIATPTRRSTPDPSQFVIPTSTPNAQGVIVVTATPTPAVTPPSVSFRSAHQSILPGDCTILYWEVENARAVFLDGEGVWGKGEKRVCQRWAGQSYYLDVLDLNGNQETHEVFVELMPFTPVPTSTPTATPVLTPTPTWTPEGATPAATTVPPRFEISLVADGGNQKGCTPGQLCEAVIQVGNQGSLADEIFVDLEKSGPWTATLCQANNICAETAMSLGIGPGDTQPIFLRVQVPEGSGGASHTFTLRAASGNANRTVQATPVQVTFYGQ